MEERVSETFFSLFGRPLPLEEFPLDVDQLTNVSTVNTMVDSSVEGIRVWFGWGTWDWSHIVRICHFRLLFIKQTHPALKKMTSQLLVILWRVGVM